MLKRCIIHRSYLVVCVGKEDAFIMFTTRQLDSFSRCVHGSERGTKTDFFELKMKRTDGSVLNETGSFSEGTFT